MRVGSCLLHGLLGHLVQLLRDQLHHLRGGQLQLADLLAGHHVEGGGRAEKADADA